MYSFLSGKHDVLTEQASIWVEFKNIWLEFPIAIGMWLEYIFTFSLCKDKHSILFSTNPCNFVIDCHLFYLFTEESVILECQTLQTFSVCSYQKHHWLNWFSKTFFNSSINHLTLPAFFEQLSTSNFFHRFTNDFYIQ